MFFSVRRRFFSGRKSSSSSWSWLREAWNFWERREAKDSFFGCSDANDGTGKKKAGVTAPWLHEYITSSSLWDWDVKKQHSLNIYGHSAGAAVMTVLLDMGWKLVFRRRANNRTEAFLSLLIGQEKHFFLSISTCSHQAMPMATLAAGQMFPPGTKWITGQYRNVTGLW